MKIISVIFQGIAPLVLIIGFGMLAIYSLLSFKNSTIEWQMILAGFVVIITGIMMVRFVQRHKQLSWFDALFGLFWWP